MRKSIIFSFIISVLTFQAFTQTDTQRLVIQNFIVKENLLKNEKIAIIACDAEEKPLEHITGNFLFTINGFKQDLLFSNGVAVAPQQIDKSTFLYLKHTNQDGSFGKLFYVIKKGTDLNPIKVNWFVLLLIPLGLIFIAMIFRKFLLIAVILIIAIFYFNSNKGLTMPTFFDTIFDGLKSLF